MWAGPPSSRYVNRRFQRPRAAAGRARTRASCTWFEGPYHTYRQVHRPWPEHDYSQSTMAANMAICAKVAKSPVYPTGHSDAPLGTTARPEIAPAHTARPHTLPSGYAGHAPAAGANARRPLQPLLPTSEASPGRAPPTSSKRMKSRSRSAIGVVSPLVSVLDGGRGAPPRSRRPHPTKEIQSLPSVSVAGESSQSAWSARQC